MTTRSKDMNGGKDTRQSLTVCHANIEPFIGIRIISHKDWKCIDQPILETEDEAREFASRNGFYIEKFYNHK
jgi:hypothetical protein